MQKSTARWSTVALAALIVLAASIAAAFLVNTALVVAGAFPERDGKYVAHGGALALSIAVTIVAAAGVSLWLSRWFIRRRDGIDLPLIAVLAAALLISTAAILMPLAFLFWVPVLRYVPGRVAVPEPDLDAAFDPAPA